MKKTKHKNEEFIMSANALGRGCGCPECAAAANSAGSESETQELINRLRKLAQEERLMVWDPASRTCLTTTDIENICINGDSVQISLSKQALETK